MIEFEHGLFALHTDHTTYAFQVLSFGHLAHLYYGQRIEVCGEALAEKHAFAPSNTVSFSPEHPEISLEQQCLEISADGKGDIREPFVELIHADGSRTSDFRFVSYEVLFGRPASLLPGSYDQQGEAETLKITLKDHSYPVELDLYYHVFEGCDTITRRAVLRNTGTEPVTVLRLMSCQLDFPEEELVLTSFHGAHLRDVYERVDQTLRSGRIVDSVCGGVSSNRVNPFFMLSRPGTGEDYGEVYGLNLVYSGNHYLSAEVSPFFETRVLNGINPRGFSWLLSPGEEFESPEAVLAFSDRGFNGLSQHMHDFICLHILRGEWADKERPVLLNSWEAAYFDINEEKLLTLAAKAKEAGCELFVMDDGWFADRNDDYRSLGDWRADPRKLPEGISGLAKKVQALGLSFGLWVEPEMVNVDSDLYRAHPDWAMEIPGRDQSEGRNQRLLDLANPLVQDYLIDSMTAVFSEEGVSYVKWDMNRIVSDAYSPTLPPERQGEVLHRYVLGLYRVLTELDRRFPHILFEGCASGGCRFDLGMLCFFPQIWASDNTDALCRARIMTNYSYGYPMRTVTAHVSACPNHQTLRDTPLATRFQVAAFGTLGYELNLSELSEAEFAKVQEEIALYKEWRSVLQKGRFYRGRSGRLKEWNVVSKDRKKAVGLLFQELTEPNLPSQRFHAKGLKEKAIYRFRNRCVDFATSSFGDGIHLPEGVTRDGGTVTVPGEKEEYRVSGALLAHAGVALLPAFSSAGLPEGVRFFPDFGSRMYFMEEE